ncbi:MAG: MFS transporter [Myxococcales bacterium 68-20]|nr:MFS transporter [Myxococcales bacterium]OJY19815.1 MAG: MFS transporter [Myxococcales bacterium 68-20]
MRSLARAFASRNYRLFFGGQVVSLIGTWMQSVAQAWLVYRLTGSVALLGLIGFCNQIPIFFLAPVGGALADRLPRRKILVGTQVASMLLAFILAGLTLDELVTTVELLVLATLLGAVNAIDLPTRQAFVIELVGSENQMNAIALNSSVVNAARVLGPALAGLLVAVIGEGWCFFLNGVSFLGVIAGLLAMRGLPAPPERPAQSPLRHVAEGFRFVLTRAPLRVLILLLGTVSLCGMPYVVLMPVFADHVLGGGAREFGILMASAGFGALSAALTLANRRELKGLLARWTMPGSVGFGAALIAFSWSRNILLSCVLLCLAGFTMMMQTASTNTLLQAMSPNALRGRTMAVYAMMFMGLAPVGSLIAGLVAERIGVPATLTAGGAICMAAGLAFRLRLPSLVPKTHELVRLAAAS